MKQCLKLLQDEKQKAKKNLPRDKPTYAGYCNTPRLGDFQGNF